MPPDENILQFDNRTRTPRLTITNSHTSIGRSLLEPSFGMRFVNYTLSVQPKRPSG